MIVPHINLGKVIKYIILFGFVYQLYDLTIDYLSFNYVLEYNVITVNAILPSVTICVNQAHLNIDNNWKNQLLQEQYMRTICQYSIGNIRRKYCSKLNKQVYYANKQNTTCITYLNKFHGLVDGNMGYFHFLAFGFSQAEFIFHPQNTPYHFERLNIFQS